jgi:Tfp pilus assembly pilus retraction ATPase PilT
MSDLLALIPGGLAVVLVWRAVDAWQGRRRRRLEQRLANGLAALIAQRLASAPQGTL